MQCRLLNVLKGWSAHSAHAQRCVATLGVILLISALTACGDQVASPNERRPRPVKISRVADANVIVGRALPGQARSAHEATLSFQVGGRILERRVKAGDRIAVGDVLAAIDPTPYKAEVASVSSNLERARAE